MATVSSNDHLKKLHLNSDSNGDNDEEGFHYEFQDENEVVKEGNEAYKNHMIKSIQERDDIINDYINKLDNKLTPSDKQIYDDNGPIDEEDLFAKAEAEYKQSKAKPVITYRNEDQTDLNFNTYSKGLLYNYSRDLLTKSINPPIPLFKHPEVLYQKEIEQLKKMQSLRKKYIHIHHVLPSLKTIEQSSDGEISKSILVNTSSSTRIIPGVSYSPINKTKLATELLVDKEKRAMKSLNDPKNPYSNDWHNHILKSRYNFKIQVNGFLNGIPQLKLRKVNIELPNVNNTSQTLENPKKKVFNKIKFNDNNASKGDSKCALPNKNNRMIEYPYILRHFKHGKSKSCDFQ